MMCLSTLGAFGSRTDSCKSTAWTKLLHTFFFFI
jgi:hypothetical protein